MAAKLKATLRKEEGRLISDNMPEVLIPHPIPEDCLLVVPPEKLRDALMAYGEGRIRNCIYLSETFGGSGKCYAVHEIYVSNRHPFEL